MVPDGILPTNKVRYFLFGASSSSPSRIKACSSNKAERFLDAIHELGEPNRACIRPARVGGRLLQSHLQIVIVGLVQLFVREGNGLVRKLDLLRRTDRPQA